MASAAYNAWVDRIKAAGGRVTVAPSRTPAVAFAGARGPLAAGDLGTVPNEYSANGRTAYFHAPSWVQVEVRGFSSATEIEAEAGAEKLLDEWGVPPMLRGFGAYSTTVIVVAVVALVVIGALFFRKR